MVIRRLAAVAIASLLALAPAVVSADEGDRALSMPVDFGPVVALTALGIGAILLVAGIGYLYRRERGLDWDFQKPDPPAHQ